VAFKDGRLSWKSSGDHNLAPARTLGFFLCGLCDSKTKGFEPQDLEFLTAGRAGKDLAPIDIELGDRDRVLAEGARRNGIVGG
jgi:hypothetical protein